MPITPLPILTDEDELKAIEKLKPPKDVVVRYGYMKLIAELPYDGGQVIGCGTKLVIRTARGMEIGEMLTTTCSNSGCGKSVSRQQMLEYIENSGGKQFPFTTEGRVLRIANVEDLNEWSRLQTEKPKFIRAAREAVKRLDLPMKIVEVEPMLGRDRIVFYFSSENRVDFRELVRQLARELHVRVEMRQVGARDEARLVADYEKCGQHCCCKQFLKVLKPVSMRSAKVQKATLDPSKISGRCGRLMCCLRYEDETYEDLRKRLPHRNTRVTTEDGSGTVVNTQILTQLVMVELDSGGARQAYPVENIEKLEGEAARRPERGPRLSEPGRTVSRVEPRRPQPGRPLREQEVESREGEQADALEPEPLLTDEPNLAPAPGSAPGSPSSSTPPIESQSREGGGRRRRRRRRGGRGPGSGPGPGAGGPPLKD